MLALLRRAANRHLDLLLFVVGCGVCVVLSLALHDAARDAWNRPGADWLGMEAGAIFFGVAAVGLACTAATDLLAGGAASLRRDLRAVPYRALARRAARWVWWLLSAASGAWFMASVMAKAMNALGWFPNPVKPLSMVRGILFTLLMQQRANQRKAETPAP